MENKKEMEEKKKLRKREQGSKEGRDEHCIHVFIPYSYEACINYSWMWLCQLYDISGSCTHMMAQKSLNYGKFFQVNTIRPQSVSFSELLVPSPVWNAVSIETSKEETCLLPSQSAGHHLCRINSLSSGAVSHITYCRPIFACKGLMILSSSVAIPDFLLFVLLS